MKAIEIVKKLVSFSPRQLEGETLAREYILNILKNKKIDYRLQNFIVQVPVYEKYYLKADGKNINCLPTALMSGKISGKENIVSSLDFSSDPGNLPNINYNPYARAISRPNFYYSPSLAIAAKDITRLDKAKKIEGMVKVKKYLHRSANILVGNAKDPQTISFAHYDGFGGGAADNASGVAICLNAIIDRNIFKKDLIVFAGAEELSFDKPDYWGHGYRVFEKKYKNLMANAKKIFVVDCVGTGKPELSDDPEELPLYFPISGLKAMRGKIFALSSAKPNSRKFFETYHSELDTIGLLKEKYLDAAEQKLIKNIQ